MPKRGRSGSYSNPIVITAKRARKAKSPARRRAISRSSGFLGLEKKFVDYEYDNAVSSSVAGSEADPTPALALNSITQGDGESQRDGRKASIKSIFIRGAIRRDGQSDVGAASMVRLILVHDRQTNGAQFNAEDVLDDPTNAGLDCYAQRNLQYSQRFRVLADKMITLPVTAGDAAACASTEVPFTIHKTLNMNTTYSGTTAVVGSITDHSLHLIAIRGGTGGDSCNLQYVSRVRFMG